MNKKDRPAWLTVARMLLEQDGYQTVPNEFASAPMAVGLVAWNTERVRLILMPTKESDWKKPRKPIAVPPSGTLEVWQRDEGAPAGWRITVIAENRGMP